MKKKLLLIMLLVLFPSLLISCTSDIELPLEKNKVEPKIEINIMQYKVEFKEAFDELAKTYTSEFPNVKININTVGGGEDYNAAFRARISSGNEPDIFNILGPQDLIDWGYKLTDLSDTIAAQKALPGTLDAVSVDGKIYGLPYNIEGYGFIYNKEIFKNAGINAKDIDTYKELVDAVEILDSKKNELGIEAVFAFPAKETWVTGLHLSSVFLSPELDNSLSALKAKTLDFKYSNEFKKIVDLQNDYSIQPAVTLDYTSQVEKYFSFGKVAIIQQGNWIYPIIEGIDPDFAQNNIGLLPIPIEGYKEDCVPVGVPNYWAVNSTKGEKNIQASKDFLSWMYTSEMGKTFVLEKLKFIPAYSDYDLTKISDPLSLSVLEYSEAGKTLNWVFMGYPTDWGMGIMGDHLQKYVAKKATWEDTIKESVTSWENLRK